MKKCLKIFTALAAIAGIVYVVATYGDQIVAWAKKMMNLLPCCKKEAEEEAVEETAPEAEEAPAVEETPAEEEVPAAEEAPAEEEVPAADEAAVEAEEADFEQ